MKIDIPKWPRIDLWWCDHTNFDVNSYGSHACLSSDERSRAAKFVTAELARRYLARRSARRKILGKYLGIPAECLNFREGTEGKPGVIGHDIHFNASHSQNTTLIAVASQPVGVDVEHLRSLPDLDNLIETVCSSSERTMLFALPESEQSAAFFSIWVQKEALVKCSGSGLSVALSRVDTEPQPQFEGNTAWLLDTKKDLAAAIACNGNTRPTLHHIHSDLLKGLMHG